MGTTLEHAETRDTEKVDSQPTRKRLQQAFAYTLHAWQCAMRECEMC